MTERYRLPQAIVSTEWLAQHLDDARLRIFDCTTHLDPPTPGIDAPYTVRNGKAEHAAGHIPGAGLLDIQAELSDNTSPSHLRFTMPAPDALARAFAQRGIGDGTRAVLYSRTTPQWATRVWWMLRAIGFDDAAVLDGGWPRWSAEGRPVSTGPCTYPAATLGPRPRTGLFVGAAEVQAAIGDAGTCTINALSPELHAGSHPRYGRPGRVPGSVNVPASSLLDPARGTFVTPDAAAAALAGAGARPEGHNLVYCGGGIAATLDAFLMVQLGYEHVAVYDASMSEWARDEALPIERD